MKANDIKMLHQKTIPELNSMVKEFREEIAKISIGIEKTKNTRGRRSRRWDIARILTILREKELTVAEKAEEKKHA